MSISELIKKLEKIREAHGDIDIYVPWNPNVPYEWEETFAPMNEFSICKHHKQMGTCLLITTDEHDGVDGDIHRVDHDFVQIIS